jgi:hypothetical protein
MPLGYFMAVFCERSALQRFVKMKCVWRGFDRKLIPLHELAPFSKVQLDRTSDLTVEALSGDYLRRRKRLIFSFSVAMDSMRSCWGTNIFGAQR